MPPPLFTKIYYSLPAPVPQYLMAVVFFFPIVGLQGALFEKAEPKYLCYIPVLGATFLNAEGLMRPPLPTIAYVSLPEPSPVYVVYLGFCVLLSD
jgi:hypothetical protein